MTRQASGIYEIVNTGNGARYIGSAVNFSMRFSKHRNELDRGKHHSRILQNAWKAHGAAQFSFRPLFICAKRDLLYYEQRALDALAPQYNVARVVGSRLGIVITEDTRERMRAAAAIRPRPPPFSAEHRARLSASGKGVPHGPMSDETKAKVSAARKGKCLGYRSPEIGIKISAAITGRKLSAEHCAKISARLKGSKQSAETIAKNVAARLGHKRGPYKKKSLLLEASK